jgi:hypothetical protein
VKSSATKSPNVGLIGSSSPLFPPLPLKKKPIDNLQPEVYALASQVTSLQRLWLFSSSFLTSTMSSAEIHFMPSLGNNFCNPYHFTVKRSKNALQNQEGLLPRPLFGFEIPLMALRSLHQAIFNIRTPVPERRSKSPGLDIAMDQCEGARS